MSVQHYKNGQLSIIAGAGGIGGGGGECDCENKTFTGTTAEVEQAIADGVIKDDYIVNITDDVTAGAADIDVLDSYEEIMANTEAEKAAGALGVKEGFEKVDEKINQINIPSILDSYNEIISNTDSGKSAGALGVKEGFEQLQQELLSSSNIYKDITEDYDNGTFSANLSKYNPGNFIKKEYNGVTYVAVLADRNTFYNPGRNDYANVNTDHWTAIVFGFTDGQMNSTNTTANGFTGSAMNTWLKGECTNIVKAAFGTDHLIAHQCLLSTGTYNSTSATHGFSWAWEADHYTMLMTEAQLGYRAWSDLGWSTGEAYKPLKIFQNESFTSVFGRDYGQSNNNFNTNHAWLRDISATSPGAYFCFAYYDGIAGNSGASGSRGRFPIIILK